MAGTGVSVLSPHTIGLQGQQGPIASPHFGGLPLTRRWHFVVAAANLLSPAAQAHRSFMPECDQAHLAATYGE